MQRGLWDCLTWQLRIGADENDSPLISELWACGIN